MTPCDPSEFNIADTLSTTDKPCGVNGIFPMPSTSRTMAKAAILIPTSAIPLTHALTLVRISIYPPSVVARTHGPDQNIYHFLRLKKKK